MKTIKPRTYLCWTKGKRLSTQQEIIIENGEGRLAALFQYAKRHGLKTIQCDAIWKKEGSK